MSSMEFACSGTMVEITVNNKPCKMQWLSSCVRLVCNNIDTSTRITLSFPHGTGFPVSIPLAPAFRLAHAPRLPSRWYNPIRRGLLSHQVAATPQARLERRRLFSLSLSRDASACIQIHRAVDDVRCETRNSFVPLKTEGSDGRFNNASLHPYFEQRVNQQVALVYARAANAPYLALTDLDDFAPSAEGMRALLDEHGEAATIHRLKDYEAPRILIKRNGKDPLLPPSRWGTRLFVDSLGAVQPKGLCPSNHSSWKELTNNASDLQHVVPNMTALLDANRRAEHDMGKRRACMKNCADGFIPMASVCKRRPADGRPRRDKGGFTWRLSIGRVVPVRLQWPRGVPGGKRSNTNGRLHMCMKTCDTLER